MAKFLSYRWTDQALVATELMQYPKHIYDLGLPQLALERYATNSTIKGLLADRFMDPADLPGAVGEAWAWLLLNGLLVRLLVLPLLVRSRYAAAGGICTQARLAFDDLMWRREAKRVEELVA